MYFFCSDVLQISICVQNWHIELKSTPAELEVIGVVSNLNSVNSQPMINSLVVDYCAAQLREFISGFIADGDKRGANGELLATSVEFICVSSGVCEGRCRGQWTRIFGQIAFR